MPVAPRFAAQPPQPAAPRIWPSPAAGRFLVSTYMRSAFLLPRSPVLALSLFFPAALSGCLGCGGDLAGLPPPPAEALRSRFPAHAAEVLLPASAFKATEQGFAL